MRVHLIEGIGGSPRLLVETNWDVLPKEGDALYLHEHRYEVPRYCRSKYRVIRVNWSITSSFSGTATYVEIHLEKAP